MLKCEVIRLIFDKEQHHELDHTNHQSVALTLSRRHADAHYLNDAIDSHASLIGKCCGILSVCD